MCRHDNADPFILRKHTKQQFHFHSQTCSMQCNEQAMRLLKLVSNGKFSAKRWHLSGSFIRARFIERKCVVAIGCACVCHVQQPKVYFVFASIATKQSASKYNSIWNWLCSLKIFKCHYLQYLPFFSPFQHTHTNTHRSCCYSIPTQTETTKNIACVFNFI